MLSGLFACTPKSAAPLEAATTAPVAAPEAVATQDAVANTPEITCESKGLGTLELDNLLIYDPGIEIGSMDIHGSMRELAEFTFGGATVMTVSSWTDFVSVLKQHCRIRELTLFFHGRPGQCLLTGGEGFLPLEQIALKFDGVAPQVDLLRIDGCNVGNDPSQMLHFLNLFQSSQVEAWNMYHFLNIVPYTVREDDTVEKIEEGFPPMEYLLQGAPPPAANVGKPGSYVAHFEWFYPSKPGVVPTTAEDIAKIPPRSAAQDLPINRKSAESINAETGLGVSGLHRVIVTA